MFLPPASDAIAARVYATGQRQLSSLLPSLDAADPRGIITPSARLLCCGLAELAETAARACGVNNVAEHGLAAARLALLTKLDDEVIDAASFHGGPTSPRSVVRERTRRFLQPTLWSLIQAAPADDSPRCLFAADLGAQLRALAITKARLQDLIALISAGWDVQVDAVEVLSAAPGSIDIQRLKRVTGDISGAWLAMVTFVGLLGAERGPTAIETDAFFQWGLAIQAADALADLHKDLRDDFVGTLPLALAYEAAPDIVDAAVADRDGRRLDAALVLTGADVLVLPTTQHLRRLDHALQGLGDVSASLRWIHGFLLGRYLERIGPHPHFQRFEPFLTGWTDWRSTHSGVVACSG